MPTVSVIIATYNPERYLTETVQSVIDQTFTDWEMVIVDDGSREDVAALIPQHPNIRLIKQTNHGLSVARNVGIMNTTGQFLAFLDQDDIWLPQKLERQVAVLQRDSDIAFCYTDFERIDGAGRRIGDGFEGGAVTYHTLLLGCCICVSTTLVRRDAMAKSGLFDPLFLGTQDYDMWLKLSQHMKVSFAATPLARYRQHGKNLSQRYFELWSEMRELFLRHIAVGKRTGDHQAVRAATAGMRRAQRVYGSQAFDHCRENLHKRKPGPMLRHLARALVMAPGFVVKSIFQYLTMLPRRRTPGASAAEVLPQPKQGSSAA